MVEYDRLPGKPVAVKTLDQITLDENDRRAIESAGQILKLRFPVDHVVLFGSKARGKDDEESDIDLLVLTKRRMSWDEESKITRELGTVQRRYSVVLSPVIIPSLEWEDGPYMVLPFHDEVDRDGVAV